MRCTSSSQLPASAVRTVRPGVHSTSTTDASCSSVTMLRRRCPLMLDRRTPPRSSRCSCCRSTGLYAWGAVTGCSERCRAADLLTARESTATATTAAAGCRVASTIAASHANTIVSLDVQSHCAARADKALTGAQRGGTFATNGIRAVALARGAINAAAVAAAHVDVGCAAHAAAACCHKEQLVAAIERCRAAAAASAVAGCDRAAVAAAVPAARAANGAVALETATTNADRQDLARSHWQHRLHKAASTSIRGARVALKAAAAASAPRHNAQRGRARGHNVVDWRARVLKHALRPKLCLTHVGIKRNGRCREARVGWSRQRGHKLCRGLVHCHKAVVHAVARRLAGRQQAPVVLRRIHRAAVDVAARRVQYQHVAPDAWVEKVVELDHHVGIRDIRDVHTQRARVLDLVKLGQRVPCAIVCKRVAFNAREHCWAVVEAEIHHRTGVVMDLVELERVALHDQAWVAARAAEPHPCDNLAICHVVVFKHVVRDLDDRPGRRDAQVDGAAVVVLERAAADCNCASVAVVVDMQAVLGAIKVAVIENKVEVVGVAVLAIGAPRRVACDGAVARENRSSIRVDCVGVGAVHRAVLQPQKPVVHVDGVA
eukprot:m.254804 g.254804  ORF g.254804 m.254804 type:complete len:604 (+) comp11007_c2_seq3:3464-5275(+)